MTGMYSAVNKEKNTGRRSEERTIMNERDELIDWLRDAYAMERGLETTLQKQAENEELSPAVRRGAAKHLEETRRLAEEVRTVLQALGTDSSALKTGIGRMAEMTKGLGTAFARDERIKD